MKDDQWLPERFDVSALWLNGVHCQVVRHDNFAEAIVHRLNRLDNESSGVFLVPAAPDNYPHDRPDESHRFWNCGTAQRAVAIAKFYATANSDVRAEMRKRRLDVSQLDLDELQDG